MSQFGYIEVGYVYILTRSLHPQIRLSVVFLAT